MLDISEPTVVIMQTGFVSNLVPRVLSYPPYGARREPWERGCSVSCVARD